MTYSGGEIRMNTTDRAMLFQGTPIGYRLIVIHHSNRACAAEAQAETMAPLLELNEQFAEMGYEFVRLERIYGG
jgi:hypothetical protein